MAYEWCPHTIELLRIAHQKRGGMKEFAKKIGLSHSRVRDKAVEIGLAKPSKNTSSREWTSLEDHELFLWIENGGSIRQWARENGRTENSAIGRAWRQGWTNGKDNLAAGR